MPRTATWIQFINGKNNLINNKEHNNKIINTISNEDRISIAKREIFIIKELLKILK